MIKNVVVFGLGWQGKQFLKFFKNNNYNVIGVCKTFKTKLKIEKEYKIKVFTNYKECLNSNLDLLVLCAYPIDIYIEVINFSKKYKYKILSDLPITFDLNLLYDYVKNDNIYFFIQEIESCFYKDYFLKNLGNILKIDCTILQNKKNLENQNSIRESIVVDTHYAMNNLLGFPLDKVFINYKFIKRKIKNIEYVIKLFLSSGDKIIYKYEDGKGISIYLKDGNVFKKNMELLTFDLYLEKYILKITKGVVYDKSEYFETFNFLFNKFLLGKQKKL